MQSPQSKTCTKCGEEKPLTDFHKNGDGLSSSCKTCKNAATSAYWYAQRKLNVRKNLLRWAKDRARKNGREFDLVEEDIDLPDVCPVFGVPFDQDTREWTYSLDRIDSSRGYTRDNIIVVSSKANTIKNDATPEELMKVAEFYSRFSL